MAAHTVCGLFAYIDPTGGLPPSRWGIFLAGILGAVGAALAFLRSFIWASCRWLWQQRLWVITTAALVGSVFVVASWYPGHRSASSGGRKVIVLGLDGLDPRLVKQYIDDGRMPTFAELAKSGIYHPLETTTPPQSPVAWASFWTGQGPEVHGVFDFLKRDPKTYLPDLTISDRKTMRLPWLGKPFWEAGDGPPVQVVVQRAPVTFPPPQHMSGRILAGMGFWDARGTEGTYFFYYSHRPVADKDARGMNFALRSEGGVFKGELPGPYTAGQADTAREPFELKVGSGEANLRLQEHNYKLLPGRWSDWIHVEFPQGIFSLAKMKLLTRALWAERDGQTTLYIAPLNFDPTASPLAFTAPKGYAAELADAIGLYYTRGMPFDTQALTDEVLSEEAFLDQCRMITGESEKMLLYEMKRFQEGLLYAYFEEPDILQHMFWRSIDPEHPLGRLSDTVRYSRVIPDCYERYDALVGRIRALAGKDTALVVLSDHGFGPFRTAIHLNSVLRDLGYLHLNGSATTSDEFFKDVDWSKTQAYAVGFNTVYLNLAGREGKGIVAAADAPRLREEIAAAIEKFVDPLSGERPVHKVHLVPTTAPPESPDLIVGYLRGYRASWETALGKVPAATAEKNGRKWSGDHCVDPSEVPGVFLSSDPTIDAESLPAVGPQIVKHLRGQ